MSLQICLLHQCQARILAECLFKEDISLFFSGDVVVRVSSLVGGVL